MSRNSCRVIKRVRKQKALETTVTPKKITTPAKAKAPAKPRAKTITKKVVKEE
jgi:hypothetical protein|tara:strand:+ start:27 stop:185 length:159 start_codon:yes stop_codon:yes gene_type:complete